MPHDRRVFGLETEYAILYEPTVHQAPEPDGPSIYDAIARSVLSRVKALSAKHRKQGHFLENGGFLHYEGRPDVMSQGLLEFSTPECRTPKEVALHSKAGEKLLADALPDAERTLAAAGFEGTLVLGKNARDAYDNTYGSHENYFVKDPLPRALVPLLLPLFFLLTLPFLLVRLTHSLCLRLYWTASWILALGGLAAILGRRFVSGRDGRPISLRIDRLLEQFEGAAWEPLMRAYERASHFLLRPLARLLSAYLRLFVFKDIRRFLPTFLATRQIFTGAGHFSRDPEEPVYSVSEKAASCSCVARLYWDDTRRRPMIDLKNFLFDGLSVVAPEKRLHLMLSDSNMSDFADFLKFGTTSLVLKAIEAGAIARWLRLAHPVEALHQVAGDPRLQAKLVLADGRPMTALEIQREYLRQCEEHFKKSEMVSLTDREVLKHWREVLDDLGQDPMRTADRIDWTLKLSLVSSSLRDEDSEEVDDPLTPLEELAPWREIVLVAEMAGVEQKQDGHDLERLHALLPREVYDRLYRTLVFRKLDPARIERYADHIYRAKKTDLKYHDISPERGYHNRARRSGLTRRVHEDEEIEQATRMPPAGTRASLRGAFVKRHHRDPRGRVNWTAGKARKARVRFASPLDVAY